MSPWRMEYIDTFKNEDNKPKKVCFFCEALESVGHEKELLVITRREHCFVMLNKFPYNNGHTLIAPNRHIGTLEELTDDEMTELTFLVRETQVALGKMYCPHGYNIGINLGRAAGAGVPGHLHYHIVPRWNGDTSFTAVFADTKIVSQSLQETQRQLSELMNY